MANHSTKEENGKPGKLSLKERFIEMRVEGYSYDDIAKALNTSKPTLISWGKELCNELDKARTLRMDELFQRYAVTKEARIQIFGEQLNRIMAELQSRELTQLSTMALFSLALKYSEALAKERIPILLKEEAGKSDGWALSLPKEYESWRP